MLGQLCLALQLLWKLGRELGRELLVPQSRQLGGRR